MFRRDKQKQIISIFLSLALIFQLIPGLMDFDFAKADTEVRSLQSIVNVPENSGFMKLEILKDAEGRANITEDSITWKLIYNSSEYDLSDQVVNLVLSEGMELKYIDNQGVFDIDRQPVFEGESFNQFESIVEEDSIGYYRFDDNVNNKEFLKDFYKVSDRTYELKLSETDQTHEIIFTTKLLDEKSNDFYSYLIYEDESEDIEIKSSSRAKVRPRVKLDLPVNISWENVPSGTEVPDTELTLMNGEDALIRRTLVSGSNFTVFEDLYKYDIDGNEIDYKLSQITSDSYDSKIDGFNVVNSYSQLEPENELEKESEADIDLDFETDEKSETSEKEDIIEKTDNDSNVSVVREQKDSKEELIDELKKMTTESYIAEIGSLEEEKESDELSVDSKSSEAKDSIDAENLDAENSVDTLNQLNDDDISQIPNKYIKVQVTYPSDPDDPNSPKIPLAGSRFRLTAKTGSPIDEFEGTTDDAGVLYFKGNTALVNTRSYRLEQIQAPFGYEKDPRVVEFIMTSNYRVTEEFSNPKKVIPELPEELEKIIPEYERNKTGIDYGVYPDPYHQTDGNSSPDELYRNRDNLDDGRDTNPKYSIPEYSKYRFGDGIDITRDRDVIENERAYIWKTATPTGKAGEYFIDLVVEGKQTDTMPTVDVVLLMDVSNSMNAVSVNGLTKMENMKNAAKDFVDAIGLVEDGPVQLGVVTYNNNVKTTIDLTTDKDYLKTRISDMVADGATFTQQGLMEANRLLRDSEADHQVIILISDGVPTVSYRVNNISENGSVDSEGHIDVNGNHEGERMYANTMRVRPAQVQGQVGRLGTGQHLGLGTTPTLPSHHKQYSVSTDITGNPNTIRGNAIATVSEAESIKNHGIEIYSIAVELDPRLGIDGMYLTPDLPTDEHNVVPKETSAGILRDIATGNNNFFDVDDSSDISDILVEQLAQTIVKKSVFRGKVTDPMGSQIILGKSDPDDFTRTDPTDLLLMNGDYLIDASNQSIIDHILFNKNSDDTLTIEELTLGNDEWMRLRYRVNLRTELDGAGNVQDPNFEEKFYLTNGEDTVLEPLLGLPNQYHFGVPAIKLPTIDIKIKKVWEGFTDSEIPASIDFKLEKSIDGDNWIEVDTITLTKPTNPQDIRNWEKDVEDLILYDNAGNEYEYRITEITTGNYTSSIETEKDEDGNYEFTATNTNLGAKFKVIKLDKETDEPLSGAVFKLYSDPALTTEVESVITDTFGLGIFENLASGTYYLKETNAPAGYEVIDSVIEVVVDGEDVTIVNDPDGVWEAVKNEDTDNILLLRVYNDKKTDLTIVKIDSNGNPITTDTATFEIYKESDYTKDASGNITINAGATPFTTVTTEADGKVTTDKIFVTGRYAVVETESPEGYLGVDKPFEIILVYNTAGGYYQWQMLNEDDHYIISTGGNQYEPFEQELFVVNKKKTNIKINKVDHENNLITTDTAIFDIYEEKDFTIDATGKIVINPGAVPITTLTTENGTITSEDLFIAGKYALVEKKRPTGYVGLADPILLKLEEDASSGTFIWTIESGEGAYILYGEEVNVVNKPIRIPDTGGTGGVVFALGGALLMVVAYIIRKKYKINII